MNLDELDLENRSNISSSSSSLSCNSFFTNSNSLTSYSSSSTLNSNTSILSLKSLKSLFDEQNSNKISLNKSEKKLNNRNNLKKYDLICDRYSILKLIGEGAFSKVFKCIDLDQKIYVAIKMFKEKHFYPFFKNEYKIVNYLNEQDLDQRYNFIRMINYFENSRNFFIIYEHLSCSLHEFMFLNELKCFNLDQIRDIGYQLCETMDFIHYNKVIHSDIKTENILFVNKLIKTNNLYELKCNKIKIIDFGSSFIFSDVNTQIVTTCNYRAPEVILKMKWSYPIDVWSVACTLFEMYTSKLLFKSTKNSFQHIYLMHCILGPLPKSMQKTKPNYFDLILKLEKKNLLNCNKLESYFSKNDNELQQFFELLKKMLNYEPKQRPTMNQLCREPFFKISK